MNFIKKTLTPKSSKTEVQKKEKGTKKNAKTASTSSSSIEKLSAPPKSDKPTGGYKKITYDITFTEELLGMSLVKGYLNYKENKSQYANQTRPVVSFVAHDSPAMLAGVSAGDIIIGLEGNSFNNFEDFYSFIGAVGRPIKISFLRGVEVNSNTQNPPQPAATQPVDLQPETKDTSAPKDTLPVIHEDDHQKHEVDEVKDNLTSDLPKLMPVDDESKDSVIKEQDAIIEESSEQNQSFEKPDIAKDISMTGMIKLDDSEVDLGANEEGEEEEEEEDHTDAVENEEDEETEFIDFSKITFDKSASGVFEPEAADDNNNNSNSNIIPPEDTEPLSPTPAIMPTQSVEDAPSSIVRIKSSTSNDAPIGRTTIAVATRKKSFAVTQFEQALASMKENENEKVRARRQQTFKEFGIGTANNQKLVKSMQEKWKHASTDYKI